MRKPSAGSRDRTLSAAFAKALAGEPGDALVQALVKAMTPRGRTVVVWDDQSGRALKPRSSSTRPMAASGSTTSYTSSGGFGATNDGKRYNR